MSYNNDYVFTSESVAEGHPDKLCDRISDEIVDLYLKKDPFSRVAVETLATHNFVILAGEVRGHKEITASDLESKARSAIKDIGYDQEGFHWKTVPIEVRVHAQSPDIAQGVDETSSHLQGAGDQGIMFGYACKETPCFMPAPIYYAHRILQSLADARHSGHLPELGPDAKSQVSLLYVQGEPVKATSIVVSTQHKEEVSQERVREIVYEHVQEALPEGWMCDEDYFYVNPTGRFVIGGPVCDTGLTGRKIIVDTYGGAAPHGGGAFSGKDPTKVDRSAAYMARYLAKNIVAAGLADSCTIELAYAIGVAHPTAFYIDLHGTGVVDDATLSKFLNERVDLSPKGIREHLKLNRPIYARTASYGHFGREPEADGGFSWEKLDLVDDLQAYYR